MAKRPQRPEPASGGPIAARSLAARVSRLRLHDWGRLAPRRLQRLAYFLRQLRERSGESMQDASDAAVADGAPTSGRTVWYLEQMMDANVAAKRERVNFLLIAYLLERWGSTLDEAWSYMTAEESWQGTEGGTGGADVRAESRALGDLYAFLAQSDPARARELLNFAQYTLEQSEREADDRQSGPGRDQGEASAVREALLGEARREIEAASADDGAGEGKGHARRSS